MTITTVPYIVGIIALNEALEFDLKTKPETKVTKVKVTKPMAQVLRPTRYIEPQVKIHPPRPPIIEPRTFIKLPPPPPPPIKVHPKVITAVQQGIFEVSPTTQKQIVKAYKDQITDTKIGETIVSQYGVGEVLYRGNGAVIDYGVTTGAETTITVPAGLVATVQIMKDSGAMGDVFTGSLLKELTVQGKEEKFTETIAKDLGVTATTFFNVMNAFGSDKHSFAFPSVIRDVRVIRGGGERERRRFGG